MENKNYEKILKNAGKTISKIWENTAIVRGAITIEINMFTIPLALNAMFFGVISKSI